jgi:hypothetical protein
MLKKAEFVHADLEYHEELLTDAKKEFNEIFIKTMAGLPPEQKEKYENIKKEQFEELRKKQEAAGEDQEEEEEEPESSTYLEKAKETFISEDFPEGIELEPSEDNSDDNDKLAVNKKLYYKIAAQTHPDKLESSNLSAKEIEKRKKLFKKAKEAYEQNNWYTLYSISIDLDIDTGDVDSRHVEWIEEDIRKTMGQISKIGQLYAWVWYVSDEKQRENIMKSYLKQVYGIEY